MNKYKFIEHLHHPQKMTPDQQEDLNELLESYPYFQTARSLLAKAKQSSKDPKSRLFINRAAVYTPDRKFLKQYLENDLMFIETKSEQEERQEKAKTTPAAPKPKRLAPKPSQKQTAAKSEKRPTSVSKPTKQNDPQSLKTTEKRKPVSPEKTTGESTRKSIPGKTAPTEQTKDIALPVAPSSDLDKLIEEVFQDMEELRKSKARFKEWQEKNDMEEAVAKAVASGKQSIDTEKTDPKEAKASSDDQPLSEQKEVKKETKDSPSEIKKAEGSQSEEDTATKPLAEKTNKEEAEKENVENSVSAADTTEPELKKEVKKKPAAAARKTATKKSTVKTKSATDSKASTKKPAAEAKKPDTKQSAAPKPKKTTASTTKNSAAKKPTVENKQTSENKESKTDKSTSEKPAGSKTPEAKTGSGVDKSPAKEEKKPESVSPKPKDQEKEKIIEEFIEKQPTISKPKKVDDPSPKDDLSKGSTRFHADIASEYLAEIYIEQGKNNRAIEIYENLSLKFPEKKSYFAGLIEKLKKK